VRADGDLTDWGAGFAGTLGGAPVRVSATLETAESGARAPIFARGASSFETCDIAAFASASGTEPSSHAFRAARDAVREFRRFDSRKKRLTVCSSTSLVTIG
jgi:hypothetical protein